ncbi:MAG: carboxypeptidase regulatory-like domain-containing protein [Tepidisphaeraceae bacterium]|jgi:beta-lactamase regulating signal transducer with metallopeptidase domain
MSEIARTLLDVEAKTVIVLVTAWLIAGFLRRRSSATRHLSWALALLAALLLPGLSILMPSWRIPLLPTSDDEAMFTASVAPNGEAAPAPRIIPTELPRQELKESSAINAGHPHLTWSKALLIVWAAGCAGVGIVWLCGVVAVRRLSREAMFVSSGPIFDSFENLRQQLAPRRAIRLLISSGASMPLTWGVFHPRILLPAQAEDWPISRLRNVLLHEFGHIARWDCGTRGLGLMGCAVHWFNPLVWIAERRMRGEQELACDDVVLHCGEEAAAYAQDLLSVARELRLGALAHMAALSMARPSKLRSRITAILDDSKNRQATTRWVVILAIALMALVLLPLAAMRLGPRSVIADPTSAPTTQSAQTVTGQVLDADGKPAAGAHVMVLMNDGLGAYVSGGATIAGNDGSFSINVPIKQPDGNASFILGIFAYVPGVAISAPARIGDAPMNLRLSPTADARLSFVDSADKPVAGVKIQPYTILLLGGGDSPVGAGFLVLPSEIARDWAATTDSAGKCVVHGLPRGAQVGFDTTDDRYAKMSFEDRVTLADDAATTAAPIHLFSSAVIVGHVINPETGKPQPGIALIAQATDTDPGNGGGNAISDPDGKFEINRLRSGSYVVSLNFEKPVGDWTAAAAEVQVTEGQQATADLTLTRGGILQGQARDSVTGKPLPGIPIGLHGPARPKSAPAVQSVVTDSNGKFSFRVPAGEQYLYVQLQALDGYQLTDILPKYPVVADGQTVTVNFDFDPDDSPALSGIVLDPDGKPVSGATVICDDKTGVGRGGIGQGEKVAQTDAGGQFKFASAGKGAVLRARWKDLATETAVTVRNPGEDETLDLSADSTFSLEIDVNDQSSGTGVGGANVMLITQNDAGFGMGSTHKADAAGKVIIPKLFTDTSYSVSAQASGYGQAQRNVKAPLGNPRQAVISLSLKKATSVIAGTLTDDAGNPLANVEVVLNGPLTGYQTTKTDSAGKFSFAVVDTVKNAMVGFRAPAGTHPSFARANAGDTDVQLVAHSSQPPLPP